MSAWQSIRILRAKPPGLVDGERLGVFVSALEQSEQLFRAAESVGPAARPLPLFYALSQAGRAIAAARLVDRWRLSGHGLSALPSTESNILRRPIAAKAKAEGRRDSFAGVAAATGSEAFNGTVELGRVWAAIPDFIEPMHQMPDLDPEWRRPLRAFLVDESHGDGSINPLRQPLQLLLDGLTPGASDVVGLLDELKQYPSAGEPGGLTGVGGYHPPGLIRTADDPQPIMTTLAPNGRLCPWFIWSQVGYWEGAACPALEEIAPVYRNGSRILLPALAGRLLSPLMLWWVLLFGLSSVARYDPEVWVAALDVNISEQAVPIEAALDVALEALPELILDALTS